MKLKIFTVAVLAATLLLALTACSKTQSTTASEKSDSTVQQTEQQSDVKGYENKDSSSRDDKTSEDEPWKKVLEERLFEEYGVIPEYYEDLGNGIYQVYVEVGGEVVPFVTVDSATGEYHG